MKWRYLVNVDPLPPKAVIVVAPHTSNWDFIIGKLCFLAIGLHPKFLIKKEWFIFPWKRLLQSMGGIPVDRSQPGGLIDTLAEQMQQTDSFYLVITPEGTRKPVNHWKRGFYHIAIKAHVPLLLAYLDYKKKIACIDQIFFPSGDYEKDLIFFANYYSRFTPKHPEKFLPPQF
ncbi:MAG: 1-acyl-sn-glycerol-3-phosphate acyltransferase [Bacteroidales bacterium]|nr:1-acyl-sn-glycerol-3-phosphate acyltransferase [Bacteroidales bacterium]